MPTVITENDVSKWDDRTGVSYHFPKRYLGILEPGSPIIYYKGTQRNKAFANQRLSPNPHYFGMGTIGKVVEDKKSGGKHYYAAIRDFREFEEPVSIRDAQGLYLEVIPSSRESNYWRDGARVISQATYNRIVGVAKIRPPIASSNWAGSNLNDQEQSLETIITGTDGKKKLIYTTVSERDGKLRGEAVRIHGTTCKACGFNFGDFYGPDGLDFIHIHHLQPLSQGMQLVDPLTDLIPLCANCHSMVHRRRDKLIAIEELKMLISAYGKWDPNNH